MSKNKNQKSVCLYFQIHQPWRLRECSFFQNPDELNYFEGPQNCRNEEIFNKVANKCYLPATKLILQLLNDHPEFKVTFSVSGVFLEQCQEFTKYGEKIIKLLKAIAETGKAEFLAETYYHSLAFLYSKEEFAEQIGKHQKIIKKLFNIKPNIFRNTELIYSNEIAEFIRQMGFKGMLAEGWDPHLEMKSPNYLRTAKNIFLNAIDHQIAKKHTISKNIINKLPVLLKNYKLSDDVAFRFSNKTWNEHPLFIEKFGSWINQAEGESINLFMDYETIGEHQWEDTGIFEFFKAMPKELQKHNIGFHTPSEAIKKLKPQAEFDVHNYLSWADSERDISAWLENDIQKSALSELSNIEKSLYPFKRSRKNTIQQLISDFGRLQTSDHLYYMCTKYWNDGDVHKYFSPYESPYEAYINFMNTLKLLKKRIKNIF